MKHLPTSLAALCFLLFVSSCGNDGASVKEVAEARHAAEQVAEEERLAAEKAAEEERLAANPDALILEKEGLAAEEERSPDETVIEKWWRGTIKAEGYMSEIGRNGLWTYRHKNGQKAAEGEYKDGRERREGLWTYWYPNGKKKSEGEYRDGKREGLWAYWYPTGKKRFEKEYKDDKVIRTKDS